MITPYLEQLIHEGKAAYRTFTVGGAYKHIMSVDTNSYIIIVQLLYFPVVNAPDEELSAIGDTRMTQLNIFSKTSFNSFVFRNNVTQMGTGATTVIMGGTPVVVPTYLVHAKDVSFTFGVGTAALAFGAAALAEPKAPTYAPPLDYGGIADPGAVATPLFCRPGVGYTIYNGGKTVPRGAGNSFEQFTYPINAASVPSQPGTPAGTPLVQVGYVKVYGQKPENVAGS